VRKIARKKLRKLQKKKKHVINVNVNKNGQKLAVETDQQHERRLENNRLHKQAI